MELVQQCAKGNRKAQYELYERYAPAMLGICERIVGAEEAEDVLQEAFLSIFKHIGQFSGEVSIGAWIKRIVVNHSLNHLRGRKLEWARLSAQWEAGQAGPSEEDGAGLKAEQALQMSVEQVKKAIQQLPEGFRIVLSLYLLEGYDHLEIAEILGISESTSKSQYSRAKAKLREMLQLKA